MSDDVSTILDETPPPDIVEQPARSRGAYKLCMECGQNVLRFQYSAGSSICKRCEEQGGRLGQPDAAPALEETPEVESEDVPASVPPPEGPGGVQRTLGGSADALAWLDVACPRPGGDPLTLDQVAATVRSLLEQRTQMIGRVTRARSLASEIRPEDVPLETAAQTLWLACDPILQEALTAAMELLGISLNEAMLGNLSFNRQDLLNQDPSLVPKASLAVQYGSGRGVLTQGNPGRVGLPGRGLVDASGQLVKDCLCCGRAFHPPRERPNPDFCDDACGTFVDQLRIWATNTVLDELRYPGSTTPAPLPHPSKLWAEWCPERCQEPFLSHALQFREQRSAQQMDQARVQQQKMRGL